MSAAAVPDMIVVIDDDYAMRLSCSKILKKMGLRVEVFEMGPGASKCRGAQARPGGGGPQDAGHQRPGGHCPGP